MSEQQKKPVVNKTNFPDWMVNDDKMRENLDLSPDDNAKFAAQVTGERN